MVLVALALISAVIAGPLSIVGNQFHLNGAPVFLNGINQAWNSYGQDFGNGKGAQNLAALTTILDQIHNSGGNSVRIWLHITAGNTPQFDSNGNVTGMDSTGTMVADMKAYMDAAASRNIFVFWCLWNGADDISPPLAGLVTVDAKLESYIENALKPMVQAVKGHAGLGGWDIMNEPEGALIIASDANPCWDTMRLSGTGPPWKGNHFYMKDLQRFVAKQARAIHTVDPTALISVGSWSERSQTASFTWKNYYSDACLSAFGDPMDYIQIHTYDYNGAYSGTSPFQKQASEFGHSKPLVIGEFASVASEGRTIQAMYQFAKNSGYAGAWGWQAAGGYQSDSQAVLQQGMASINNTYGGTTSPPSPAPTSPTNASPTNPTSLANSPTSPTAQGTTVAPTMVVVGAPTGSTANTAGGAAAVSVAALLAVAAMI